MARKFAIDSLTERSETAGLFIMQINIQPNSPSTDGGQVITHVASWDNFKFHYSTDSDGSNKLGVLSVNGTTYQLSNATYDVYTVPNDATIYDNPCDALDALIASLPS